MADTGYVISELPKAKTTACDVILDALSLTFKATGIRHYVTSADGKLSLIKRKDSILQWVVETGRNLISYDYTCSIEKVKTRIKLLSKEDKVLAEKADTELEKTIGIMQDISTPDSNTEEANLTDMAESMLAEQKLPSKTLTIGGPRAGKRHFWRRPVHHHQAARHLEQLLCRRGYPHIQGQLPCNAPYIEHGNRHRAERKGER